MKHLNKKDILLLTNKLIKNLPDPRNSKEHYQSIIQPVKQSEIITYQRKTFDIVDITSVITEHPKTSHKDIKLHIKTIRHLNPILVGRFDDR